MAYLSELSIRCFRNLSCVELSFPPGMTVLSGRNGQGKSNVIEAIAYLALLRSFRTRGIAHLHQWHTDSFSLGGYVQDDDRAYCSRLEVTQGERRRLTVNGSPVSKASDFINTFLCVPLVPEDIALVKGSASGRRRFLDIVLSQHDAAYMGHLQRYREVLRRRNALLRHDQGMNEKVLATFDELLIHHGAALECSRQTYVRVFDRNLRDLSTLLFEGKERTFSLRYQSPGLSGTDMEDDRWEEVLREALTAHRHRDERERHTSVGPHRADFTLLLDGRPLVDFGSEGERRMGALVLRLASLKVIKEQIQDKRAVVVLIDDVMGELDDRHTENFFDLLGNSDQIILTLTEMTEGVKKRMASHMKVMDGRIVPF